MRICHFLQNSGKRKFADALARKQRIFLIFKSIHLKNVNFF